MAISRRSRQCIQLKASRAIRTHHRSSVYAWSIQMVGSTLQWGRERQLSRVILKPNFVILFAKSPKRLLGTGWAGQPTPGGGFRSVGHDASQATAPSRKAKNRIISSIRERLPKLQTLNNPRSDNLCMASSLIHGSHVVESLPILLEDWVTRTCRRGRPLSFRRAPQHGAQLHLGHSRGLTSCYRTT